MKFVDLIERKKQGCVHSREEICYIVNSIMNGEAYDYQISAWLMAMYFKVMKELHPSCTSGSRTFPHGRIPATGFFKRTESAPISFARRPSFPAAKKPRKANHFTRLYEGGRIRLSFVCPAEIIQQQPARLPYARAVRGCEQPCRNVHAGSRAWHDARRRGA